MAKSEQRTIAALVVGSWHPESYNTWSAWCLAHHARCHRAIWLGPALSPALSAWLLAVGQPSVQVGLDDCLAERVEIIAAIHIAI